MNTTLWAYDLYRCVLATAGGRYELMLFCEGRILRQRSIDSEPAARDLAHGWRTELVASEQV